MKKKRIIKLSKSQVNQLINEDYPFSYLGNESTPTNHNSTVAVNVPFDSPDVDPVNTTTGDVADTITTHSWWNKGFGKSGYCR